MSEHAGLSVLKKLTRTYLKLLCLSFFLASDQNEYAAVPRQHCHLHSYSVCIGSNVTEDLDREK